MLSSSTSSSSTSSSTSPSFSWERKNYGEEEEFGVRDLNCGVSLDGEESERRSIQKRGNVKSD